MTGHMSRVVLERPGGRVEISRIDTIWIEKAGRILPRMGKGRWGNGKG